MRIKRLLLENFGPFHRYDIPFVDTPSACVLLTGKNNEGKSNIILALKLLSSACRSVGKRKMLIVLDDNEYFKLPQQDIDRISIGRILHNYSGECARIHCTFDDDFQVTIYLNEKHNLIYADYGGVIPKDSTDILGFIPPLGPLAETEELLSSKYIRACINTSLAPRHLRNHLYQILGYDEYPMVQEIINTTWSNIKLLDYELNYEENILSCYFKEGRIEREIGWAGQGLQVWFQIITHLIRLRSSSVLVLDEPEINLHAEKQNDLIQVLKEHHTGSVIIATHSIELMNNVDVSHIIHVQKKSRKPTIKSTANRANLELVRSQVGSNFNLIASQFETFETILYTEDGSDFKIIQDLANAFGFNCSIFSIPLHGFSEYPKALCYREAYRMLIGGKVSHTVFLDRDYYPERHLVKVQDDLACGDISTLYTPGKEIENLFLSPSTLNIVIPEAFQEVFGCFWDRFIDSERLDAYGSYLTLHKQFLDPKLDMKTITKKYTPTFNAKWNDKSQRHTIIPGKKALQQLRGFYRDKTGKNLTMPMLIRAVAKANDKEARSIVGQALGKIRKRKQTLHY
ncbi:MAG: hypothetical protein CEE38_19040 [Planctomycetes bacterium B3_Pla]|nr:MAG: hypothetical protein CEE38_19040 [Planctomycetes bacterium B3_Pla]